MKTVKGRCFDGALNTGTHQCRANKCMGFVCTILHGILQVCVLLWAHLCARSAVGLYHPKVFKFSSPLSLRHYQAFSCLYAVFSKSMKRQAQVPPRQYIQFFVGLHR